MEWLGDVPEHWNTKPTKYCFKLITDKAIENNSEVLLSVYTDIGVKPRSELEERGNKASTTDGYWIVKKGDIIVNKLLAWMGAIGLSNYSGVTSPAYDILRIKHNYTPEYYNYLFRNGDMFTEFKRYSRGLMDMRLRLYFSEFGNIKLPVPSIDEQQKIVSFLNTETARIDNLIAKQEKLIELLEEQRKSIISHAVTKGLNPNAPMKDSGLEWLGDVPEHWEVIPSKFYFKERKEKAEIGDKQLTASQKHGIIYQDEFIAENGRVMVVMKNPEILKKVRPNDFVISMRSFQGGLELSYLEGSISSAYVMLKPDLSLIHIEYFKYLFKTPRYIQSLQSTSNLIRDGQALRFNNFSQVKLILPPKSEQQEIVEYLDEEKNKIDNLISTQIQLIEKLKEYRSSIISHAVTGKIDVREFDA